MKNPKFETLNTKQYLNPKSQCFKQFGIWKIVISNLLRISILGFSILLLLNYWSFASEFVPGEIIVKYKSGKIKAFSAEKLQKKFKIIAERRLFKKIPKIKIQSLRRKDLSAVYKLKFSPTEEVSKVVEEYKKDPNVEYAEPNYIYKSSVTPNDPYFVDSGTPNQWGFYQVDAQNAWALTKGSTSVIIAVIDTGVDYNHPDLSANIWTNSGETADNGIDDDGNGYIDDVRGWDFVSVSESSVYSGEDYAPEDNNPMDVQGHGTHVSGIASAVTDNSKGIAGMGWNCKIMPVRAGYKATDGDGSFTATDIAEAIKYAADNGADVLNMSFGSPALSLTLQEVIEYAVGTPQQELNTAYSQKDCILVAAAGNDNKDQINYPAGYSNVIAVGATDADDKPAVWTNGRGSNFGSWVSVAAPGSAIYSTYLSNQYAALSGTSMATPLISGIAALIRSRYPNLTNAQVVSQIVNTESCDDIDYTSDPSKSLGAGRINALKAVSGGLIAEITSPSDNAYIKGTVSIVGTAWGGNFQAYTLEAYPTGDSSNAEVLKFSASAATGETFVSWDTTAKSDGAYTIRLKAADNTGSTAQDTVAVTVDNTAPIANITFPVSGRTVEGNIIFRGTAADTNLDYYKLEYGKGSSPSEYHLVTYATTSVSTGILGTWETIGLNGTYTVKLSAKDKAESTATHSFVITLLNAAAPQKEVEGVIRSGPNPFNPVTQSTTYISYRLSGNFDTTLYIFDLAGNLIYKKTYQAGEEGGKASNSVPWNGSNMFGEQVANGVYFYRVVADGKVMGKGKILVLK